MLSNSANSILSNTVTVEVESALEEVWAKLADFERYAAWSPCFASVINRSPQSMSYVGCQVYFDCVRLKERVRCTATIEDFTIPQQIIFTFTRPYAFWLKERWVIQVHPAEMGNTLVTMAVDYSGWNHLKAYRQEGFIMQSFFEVHLEALKVTLARLPDDSDDDFVPNEFLSDYDDQSDDL